VRGYRQRSVGFLLRGCLAFVAGHASAGDLTLEIRHLWHGKPFRLAEDWLTGEAGGALSLTRLTYLLSAVQLEGADGSRLGRNDWYGLVNAEEGASLVRIGGVPGGKFSALDFSIGLDGKTNTSDPNQYPPDHPLNPVRNHLHWDWQSGYIFLAVEGVWRAVEGEESGFSYHLGNAPHLMRISLPVALDLSDDTVLTLDFHLDQVLEGIALGEETSTHGREGDPLAMNLKGRVEKAFEIRAVRHDVIPIEALPENRVPGIGTPYRFRLKAGFPLPPLPLDYPLTEERVELGRRLFNDKALSRDDTISCASCHAAGQAFTDARRFSVGIDGQVGRRQAMPLVNLAWKSRFFWDGRASSLREQALIPIQDATEMHESLENVCEKLAADSLYSQQFAAAFGVSGITSEHIGIAIEQYLITLTSLDSKFDQARRGETQMTEEEARGFELFVTEYDPRRQEFGADCFHCHGGAFFTDHRFHNNGLDSDFRDRGLEAVTAKESDRGKFATPSLRNVALTAPYMHDGRFATLEEAVDHYTSGLQRSATLDPNLGKHGGAGIPLSAPDKAALLAFLRTLSDPQFSE
jgi:cytochrome c peroxidase